MEYVPCKVNVNNYNILIIGIIVILLIGVICFFMNRGNKSEQKIPKIIIQTYKTKDLPEYYQNIVNHNRNLNPEYEYKFFDDKDCLEFIKNNYDSRTLNAFRKINPKYGASKADFFRYCAMYKYGGVYLDIKSKILKPLNHLIKQDDEYILSYWKQKYNNSFLSNEKGEFQNWHIICVPGHPYLKAVIENVINNIENYSLKKYPPSKDSVIFLTGPVAYTRTIIPILNKYNHRITQNYNCDNLLEYSENKTGLFKDSEHLKIEGNNHYSRQTEEIILKTNTNIYLTMTTIPERLIHPWFYENLKNTLNLNGDFKVLLNIPNTFKSTGEEYIIPQNVLNLQKGNLIINRVSEDYGPITKLFGALLNENISDNDVLLVCDDDIHYKKDFVNIIYNEYIKDNSKIYTYCNEKIEGYLGYMMKKSLIKPILNINRPQSCFRIDDNIISEWILQNKISIVTVLYYGDNSWTCSFDRRKTDTHPRWTELNSDNRGKIIQQCLYDYRRMN